jgi:glycosyltransferase involved in cell wall biosynthesis
MSYGILGALTGFKPLVISAWGSDVLITPSKSKLRKWALTYAIARAELVTSLAVHISEALHNLGIPQSKIVTMPFGVDTRVFFQPTTASPRGIDVICTRNFDHVYNLELLLQALSMVIPRRPGVTCALAGDGPLKPHLQRLISRLRIKRNVQWLGWLPTMDLANYLRQSKVFINPSSSDGTSTALTEAMACGCFPIATDIAANRPWVKEGVAGYLVPSDRPDILADRILHALDSVELRNQAASLNEETVKSRANWYTNMAQIESHYYRLAKEPSSPAGAMVSSLTAISESEQK